MHLCTVLCYSSPSGFISLLQMIRILIYHKTSLLCLRGHGVNERGIAYRQFFFLLTNNNKLSYVLIINRFENNYEKNKYFHKEKKGIKVKRLDLCLWKKSGQ